MQRKITYPLLEAADYVELLIDYATKNIIILEINGKDTKNNLKTANNNKYHGLFKLLIDIDNMLYDKNPTFKIYQ